MTTLQLTQFRNWIEFNVNWTYHNFVSPRTWPRMRSKDFVCMEHVYWYPAGYANPPTRHYVTLRVILSRRLSSTLLSIGWKRWAICSTNGNSSISSSRILPLLSSLLHLLPSSRRLSRFLQFRLGNKKKSELPSSSLNAAAPTPKLGTWRRLNVSAEFVSPYQGGVQRILGW